MPESKAIQRLQEKMAGIQAGTIRYEALEAAKRFKSSWIELGRVLWTVHREKKFKEWGYLTFEAYCAKEISIRAATAKKLLHSYFFLEREEPSLLKRLSEQPPAAQPDLDAVNVLRLLKRRPQVPEQGYQRVRDQVLEEGRPAAQVREQVKALLPQPPDGEREAVRRRGTVRRMISAMKIMSRQMKEERMVPAKLLDEVGRLIQKLETAL